MTLLKLIAKILFHQRKYIKLGWRFCDELQMNQFDAKETRVEFLVNNCESCFLVK